MAVGVLVDAPAVLLLQGLDAVRDTPAPLGLVPARLGVLARAAAELQGVYLRELDRAERDGAHRAAGCRSTADLLVDTAGLPVSQARSDTALARRLGLVPGLLDALAGGGLELAAARLVAKAFAALPARLRDTATAGALISLAGLVDLADLKAKVDELCAALAPDVTDSDLADARETGELTLTDVGAQTRLGGHTDALTGEWLRDVLAAKAEADRGLADPRTSGQRLLDALLDCVRVAIDAGAVPGSDTGAPTLVVVTTETDLLRTTDPRQPTSRPRTPSPTCSPTCPRPPRRSAQRPCDEPQSRDGGGRGTGGGDRCGSARPGHHTTEAGRWSTRSRGGVRLGPRSPRRRRLHRRPHPAAHRPRRLARRQQPHQPPAQPPGTPRPGAPRRLPLRTRRLRPARRRLRPPPRRPLGPRRPQHPREHRPALPQLPPPAPRPRPTPALTRDRRIGPRGWIRGSNDPPDRGSP